MKKIVLVYGLIAGAIVGGLMFATWPLHENDSLNMETGMLVGYTTMIIALSLIFFAVKSYRDNHLNGIITFGNALKVGLLITVVAAIIYSLSWEVLYNTVAQDIMTKMTDHYVQDLKESGASEAEMEAMRKEMETTAEWYKNPVARFGFTLTEILPIGILISFISAALLRKKQIVTV